LSSLLYCSKDKNEKDNVLGLNSYSQFLFVGLSEYIFLVLGLNLDAANKPYPKIINFSTLMTHCSTFFFKVFVCSSVIITKNVITLYCIVGFECRENGTDLSLKFQMFVQN